FRSKPGSPSHSTTPSASASRQGAGSSVAHTGATAGGVGAPSSDEGDGAGDGSSPVQPTEANRSTPKTTINRWRRIPAPYRAHRRAWTPQPGSRSEEHTSELQ